MRSLATAPTVRSRPAVGFGPSLHALARDRVTVRSHPAVGFDPGVQALARDRAAVRSRPVVEKETRGGRLVARGQIVFFVWRKE